MASRDLPPEHVGELTEARRRLMAVLSRHARIIAPERTAEAQLEFDCWMQEQEENRQPKDFECKPNGQPENPARNVSG